jgi:hypothetical protein
MAQAQILRIVVASPSDVQPERDLLPDVIEELNRGIADERGFHLVLSRWETDAHPGFHSEGPQGLIDPVLNIADCDLLIGIFWKRFGTPTINGQTGTEHEFRTAYEAWQKNRSPQIMVYFNQKPYAPKSKTETDQWGQVLEFQRNFPEEGLWWPYNGESEFEKLVRNHLTIYIRKLPKLDGGNPLTVNDQSGPATAPAGSQVSPEAVPTVRIESRGNASVAAQYIINSEVNIRAVSESSVQRRTPAQEFGYRSKQAMKRIRTTLTWIKYFHPRPELENIEAQFRAGKPVLLSGEAGSGKSAIGVKLAESAYRDGKEALLLDARDVAHFRDEMELRSYFSSPGPLNEVISEIGSDRGFRLIIDQVDNLIGKTASRLLIDLALDCANSEGVDVIVISRNREAHEARLLRRLTAGGFNEIESQNLREEEVAAILGSMGITEAPQGLIRLGQNLLNLDIVCIIKQQQPDFAFAAISDEITLWDKYVRVIQDIDEMGISLIGSAMNLARQSLMSEKMSVAFDGPLQDVESRLESWDIIVCEDDEFVYRFKYEKFQDYLYSRLMCGKGAMPGLVLSEVGRHRMRTILPVMNAIYKASGSATLTQFLRETFNVG